jgi:hypothetical protein
MATRAGTPKQYGQIWTATPLNGKFADVLIELTSGRVLNNEIETPSLCPTLSPVAFIDVDNLSPSVAVAETVAPFARLLAAFVLGDVALVVVVVLLGASTATYRLAEISTPAMTTTIAIAL